jgi:uncharacterized membrane protein
LFYLALLDKKFAILGDAGINTKVPEGFWNDINQTVLNHFKVVFLINLIFCSSILV